MSQFIIHLIFLHFWSLHPECYGYNLFVIFMLSECIGIVIHLMNLAIEESNIWIDDYLELIIEIELKPEILNCFIRISYTPSCCAVSRSFELCSLWWTFSSFSSRSHVRSWRVIRTISALRLWLTSFSRFTWDSAISRHIRCYDTSHSVCAVGSLIVAVINPIETHYSLYCTTGFNSNRNVWVSFKLIKKSKW